MSAQGKCCPSPTARSIFPYVHRSWNTRPIKASGDSAFRRWFGWCVSKAYCFSLFPIVFILLKYTRENGDGTISPHCLGLRPWILDSGRSANWPSPLLFSWTELGFCSCYVHGRTFVSGNSTVDRDRIV